MSESKLRDRTSYINQDSLRERHQRSATEHKKNFYVTTPQHLDVVLKKSNDALDNLYYLWEHEEDPEEKNNIEMRIQKIENVRYDVCQYWESYNTLMNGDPEYKQLVDIKKSQVYKQEQLVQPKNLSEELKTYLNGVEGHPSRVKYEDINADNIRNGGLQKMINDAQKEAFSVVGKPLRKLEISDLAGITNDVLDRLAILTKVQTLVSDNEDTVKKVSEFLETIPKVGKVLGGFVGLVTGLNDVALKKINEIIPTLRKIAAYKEDLFEISYYLDKNCLYLEKYSEKKIKDTLEKIEQAKQQRKNGYEENNENEIKPFAPFEAPIETKNNDEHRDRKLTRTNKVSKLNSSKYSDGNDSKRKISKKVNHLILANKRSIIYDNNTEDIDKMRRVRHGLGGELQPPLREPPSDFKNVVGEECIGALRSELLEKLDNEVIDAVSHILSISDLVDTPAHLNNLTSDDKKNPGYLETLFNEFGEVDGKVYLNWNGKGKAREDSPMADFHKYIANKSKKEKEEILNTVKQLLCCEIYLKAKDYMELESNKETKINNEFKKKKAEGEIKLPGHYLANINIIPNMVEEGLKSLQNKSRATSNFRESVATRS